MNLQEAHLNRAIGILLGTDEDLLRRLLGRRGLELSEWVRFGKEDSIQSTQVKVALYFMGVSDVSLSEVGRNLLDEDLKNFFRALLSFYELDPEELC